MSRKASKGGEEQQTATNGGDGVRRAGCASEMGSTGAEEKKAGGSVAGKECCAEKTGAQHSAA